MKLVKHATNEEVKNSIILQCPYCSYSRPLSNDNQIKMLKKDIRSGKKRVVDLIDRITKE